MKARWWLVLLAVALVAGWWAGSRLRAPAALRVPPDSGCDLALGPCTRALPDGSQASLSLSPLPPRVMIPLTLQLSLDRPARAVWVDFVGRNMDMGFNRAELTPTPGGLWEGQVVLPVCSAAQMVWEARLYIARDDGLLEVPFGFATRP